MYERETPLEKQLLAAGNISKPFQMNPSTKSLTCSGPHIYTGRAQKQKRETLLKSSEANSTQCSQADGHKKMSTFYFNNTLTYMRFCTQVRLKCWLELRLFPQLPTGFLSVSSSLKPLFPCFEHIYARNIAEIRLRFAIWGAFSSLRIQICSLKACFKTRKISFLPLIHTIPTRTSWYFESPLS